MAFFDTFKDTIFLKESSDLQDKYNALSKLNEKYPNNKDIKEELYIVKRGLKGENEIRYQLSKANLGLYVLHDLNIQYEDLKAQIDYVVLSKAYCYFIECKNLVGNITVNEKGDFIREYTVDSRKIKKGMYSPIRQVEAQRDVYKKLWNNALSNNVVLNNLKRALAEDNFTNTHRVLVVASNNETILNTKDAPKDIKYKVIKADALVRQIQYDLEHCDKDQLSSKNSIEKWAMSFVRMHKMKNVNYYTYYMNKFIKENDEKISDDLLREKLIELRKTRSNEMGIPVQRTMYLQTKN